MWLVIFPEGTRYNPDKPDIIKESQQFAADKGIVGLGFSTFVKAVFVLFFLFKHMINSWC